MSEIEKFAKDQISLWPHAAANFRALRSAKSRHLTYGGLNLIIQHNPARIVSCTADLDEESIKARPCTLCAENRPQEQHSLRFEGRKDREYDILLNLYPIFPKHLVIASAEHAPQGIWHRFSDLCDLAHHYTDYTFFYNGPKCGASLPDHMHFQACPRGLMPLEQEADKLLGRICEVHADCGVPDGEETTEIPPDISPDVEFVASLQEAQLYHYKKCTRGVFFLRSRTSKSLAKLFYRLLDCSPVVEGETEPRFNLLAWYSPTGEGSERPEGMTHGMAAFEYRAVVIFRSEHRPHHFFAAGAEHLSVSPGCADMAGFIVAATREDYEKLNSVLIGEILEEVTLSEEAECQIIWRLTRTQPKIEVGILTAPEICFEVINDGAGPQRVKYREGKIDYGGELFDSLTFSAQTRATLFAEPSFVIYDVVIGVDFHWQRKVTQQFAGTLKFIVEGGKVVAVNEIGVEDYLLSVISSEMKSSATLEYLKAHSVISRSWVMRILQRRRQRANVLAGKEPYKGGLDRVQNRNDLPGGDSCKTEAGFDPPQGEAFTLSSLVTHLDSMLRKESDEGGQEYIKWFGDGDHKKYDVCADDHCQRYQGLSMAVGENVRKAIDSTWGQVLTYNGEICDCRFYKCCGGVTEQFSTCWEDKDFAYLPALPDTPGHEPEEMAFCNTSDKAILSQVLNDYDLETRDFFSWKVEYSREDLSALIRQRSGIDFGTIQALIPLRRGLSGRISLMKVVGSKKEMTVGKELIIRRWLSPSHLKSSAFDIRWEGDKFVLDGRGWGHGVGLCQIGAAVMAYRGYTYPQILEHYYPNSSLTRL